MPVQLVLSPQTHVMEASMLFGAHRMATITAMLVQEDCELQPGH
jgi:hypothetical protein